MSLLDNFSDKLGKYLGLKKQDSSVQIFEETADLSAKGGSASGGKSDFLTKPQLEKKTGDVILEDEREKARKEVLAELEKEADE